MYFLQRLAQSLFSRSPNHHQDKITWENVMHDQIIIIYLSSKNWCDHFANHYQNKNRICTYFFMLSMYYEGKFCGFYILMFLEKKFSFRQIEDQIRILWSVIWLKNYPQSINQNMIWSSSIRSCLSLIFWSISLFCPYSTQ